MAALSVQIPLLVGRGSELNFEPHGYKCIQLIGRGSGTTKVYLVSRISDDTLWAAKFIEVNEYSQVELAAAKRESELIQTLSHENVVSCIESFTLDHGAYLVMIMEYCEGGDLLGVIKRLKDENRQFDEAELRFRFKQMLEGLAYVHSKRIIHRDIKPGNILIAENGDYKLGDFGISRPLAQTNEQVLTRVGTTPYMAPEVINTSPYDEQSDIWGLACVIYEMAALQRAFRATNAFNIALDVLRLRPAIPSIYSEGLRKLVTQMFSLSPAKRMSAREILASSYFNPIDLSLTEVDEEEQHQPEQNENETRYLSKVTVDSDTSPEAYKHDLLHFRLILLRIKLGLKRQQVTFPEAAQNSVEVNVSGEETTMPISVPPPEANVWRLRDILEESDHSAWEADDDDDVRSEDGMSQIVTVRRLRLSTRPIQRSTSDASNDCQDVNRFPPFELLESSLDAAWLCRAVQKYDLGISEEEASFLFRMIRKWSGLNRNPTVLQFVDLLRLMTLPVREDCQGRANEEYVRSSRALCEIDNMPDSIFEQNHLPGDLMLVDSMVKSLFKDKEQCKQAMLDAQMCIREEYEEAAKLFTRRRTVGKDGLSDQVNMQATVAEHELLEYPGYIQQDVFMLAIKLFYQLNATEADRLYRLAEKNLKGNVKHSQFFETLSLFMSPTESSFVGSNLDPNSPTSSTADKTVRTDDQLNSVGGNERVPFSICTSADPISGVDEQFVHSDNNVNNSSGNSSSIGSSSARVKSEAPDASLCLDPTLSPWVARRISAESMATEYHHGDRSGGKEAAASRQSRKPGNNMSEHISSSWIMQDRGASDMHYEFSDDIRCEEFVPGGSGYSRVPSQYDTPSTLSAVQSARSSGYCGEKPFQGTPPMSHDEGSNVALSDDPNHVGRERLFTDEDSSTPFIPSRRKDSGGVNSWQWGSRKRVDSRQTVDDLKLREMTFHQHSGSANSSCLSYAPRVLVKDKYGYTSETEKKFGSKHVKSRGFLPHTTNDVEAYGSSRRRIECDPSTFRVNSSMTNSSTRYIEPDSPQSYASRHHHKRHHHANPLTRRGPEKQYPKYNRKRFNSRDNGINSVRSYDIRTTNSGYASFSSSSLESRNNGFPSTPGTGNMTSSSFICVQHNRLPNTGGLNSTASSTNAASLRSPMFVSVPPDRNTSLDSQLDDDQSDDNITGDEYAHTSSLSDDRSSLSQDELPHRVLKHNNRSLQSTSFRRKYSGNPPERLRNIVSSTGGANSHRLAYRPSPKTDLIDTSEFKRPPFTTRRDSSPHAVPQSEPLPCDEFLSSNSGGQPPSQHTLPQSGTVFRPNCSVDDEKEESQRGRIVARCSAEGRATYTEYARTVPLTRPPYTANRRDLLPSPTSDAYQMTRSDLSKRIALKGDGCGSSRHAGRSDGGFSSEWLMDSSHRSNFDRDMGTRMGSSSSRVAPYGSRFPEDDVNAYSYTPINRGSPPSLIITFWETLHTMLFELQSERHTMSCNILISNTDMIDRTPRQFFDSLDRIDTEFVDENYFQFFRYVEGKPGPLTELRMNAPVLCESLANHRKNTLRNSGRSLAMKSAPSLSQCFESDMDLYNKFIHQLIECSVGVYCTLDPMDFSVTKYYEFLRSHELLYREIALFRYCGRIAPEALSNEHIWFFANQLNMLKAMRSSSQIMNGLEMIEARGPKLFEKRKWANECVAECAAIMNSLESELKIMKREVVEEWQNNNTRRSNNTNSNSIGFTYDNSTTNGNPSSISPKPLNHFDDYYNPGGSHSCKPNNNTERPLVSHGRADTVDLKRIAATKACDPYGQSSVECCDVRQGFDVTKFKRARSQASLCRSKCNQEDDWEDNLNPPGPTARVISTAGKQPTTTFSSNRPSTAQRRSPCTTFHHNNDRSISPLPILPSTESLASAAHSQMYRPHPRSFNRANSEDYDSEQEVLSSSASNLTRESLSGTHRHSCRTSPLTQTGPLQQTLNSSTRVYEDDLAIEKLRHRTTAPPCISTGPAVGTRDFYHGGISTQSMSIVTPRRERTIPSPSPSSQDLSISSSAPNRGKSTRFSVNLGPHSMRTPPLRDVSVSNRRSAGVSSNRSTHSLAFPNEGISSAVVSGRSPVFVSDCICASGRNSWRGNEQSHVSYGSSMQAYGSSLGYINDMVEPGSTRNANKNPLAGKPHMSSAVGPGIYRPDEYM